MNTRFVVPAVVALGFHAALLVGFPSSPVVAIGGKIPPAAPDVLPPDAVQLQARDPVDADATANSAPAPAVAPRSIFEPSPIPVSGPQITIPAVTPTPVSGPADPRRMGPLTPGDGGGNLHGGPQGPISSAFLDRAPRTRAQVAPIYPYEARVGGRGGEVLVAFTVNESGMVLDPHVLRSSDPLFERPTLQAVAKWRFEPGRKDGRVVRFRMTVPVAFAVNP